MPPKSNSNKKSATASWYYCETCNVHITSKDRETHEAVCPIAEDVGGDDNPTDALEYIRDGVLYTASVERCAFTVEELKDLPVKCVNNLLFMSEGAMRLSRLHIGQPVAISAPKCAAAATLVRTLWPVPEKFLTTLFAADEDFKLYWPALKGVRLKIQALPDGNARPAKIVQLKLTTADSVELSPAQLKDVARILRIELKQLIYTRGSTIHLNFFNKQLQFSVSSWTFFEVEDENTTTLAEAFGDLCLDEHKRSFFKITTATNFEIEPSVPCADSVPELKPLITKSDIGGLASQLELVEESMKHALGLQPVPKGVKISRGLLLYGSTGCGKSLICEAMCAELQQRYATAQTHIVRLKTGELFSKFLGETEKNLGAHFERAFANYPHATLMIIEDVHNLCPKHETNEVVKRVSVAFAALLDALSSRREAQHTFLLATSSHIDALNPSIRRCGRLDCEVEIGAPTPEGRAAILRCLLRNVAHCLPAACIEEVAQVTHGYVGADLASLVYSASLLALKAGKDALCAEHIHASLTRIKPSAMREVLIENPNVHWSDIGGQAELKLKLQQAIEWPLLYPEKFKRLGIKPPRGILMYGPPGCSKTMIAKALATESQLNFLSIKGPELFSMWVGESERAVREVFRKARQVAPAIVFFDEIDAIGGEREGGAGGSGSSVKERVLTQLLTELDGVEALENVTIVAATNRPDMIDKALLRPGRIDRIVYVGLPNAEARSEVFRIKLRSMPLAEDVDVQELVRRTEGYSGAEMQAVCHEAALKTLEESFEAEHVSWQQFEYALGLVKPRTSEELLRLYEEYAKKS